MCHYQVTLTPELEENYKQIAEQLDMSIEQVLSCAVQIYAERLMLRSFEKGYNEDRVRNFEEQCKAAKRDDVKNLT